MNYRRITGLVILLVGLALIIFSVHAMEKAPEAKSIGQKTSDFFTHNPMWNPLIKFFGGKPQEKIIEQHSSQVLTLIVGIFLAAIGSIVAFWKRKKRS